MSGQYSDFQYQSLPEIPEEFRQVDRAYINLQDKPFAEAEGAFHQLREKYQEAFSDKPFASLEFLRAIEDRLVMLAVEKRQPISTVLEHLRRRLDLEYSRSGIYGKAAQLVVVADYAAQCHEIGLAEALLKAERDQLNETVETCRSWLETINDRIDKLRPGGTP